MFGNLVYNETNRRTNFLYDGESLENSRPGTSQHTIIQVPGMVGQICTHRIKFLTLPYLKPRRKAGLPC